MRVLFADKLAPLAAQQLEALGHQVVIDGSLGGEALRDAIALHGPDALVVRSTQVTAEHLGASPALSLVVRAGAGTNTIDTTAAGRLGIFVANCPGRNAAAVAELTLGLMLAVDRHIADAVIDARAGRWNKGAHGEAQGLKGRTLGILGMGRIGEEVARRALAFDMNVVAWSRSLTPERAAALEVAHAATPGEVADAADVLTLHLAATPETRGLVGRELLGRLRPGAVLVNTARHEVVDEPALLEALEAGRLRAGLDVFAGEPPGKQGAFESPLAAHPGVVLTHHVGASTDEAQDAVAQEVVRILRAYDTTGRPPNAVNLITETSASHLLVVRHLDRVGVLAAVLGCLRASEVNVEEMENTVFAGGEAALARLQVSRDCADLLDALRALPHVLHAACVPIRRAT